MTHYEAYMDTKRVPLQLDPSSFIRTADHDIDSNNTSPDSTAPEHSPRPMHLNTRPSSRGSPSELLDYDDEREPATGPHRSRSVSSAKSDKEKRKRSRVTPEQLVHLERFFAVDRSPTAARRREISDLLGMQERQTQIWFQNRRAKAKLQDSKKGRSGSVEVPPDSPPQLSTGFEVDLHNLIHEDEPVTIIPCTDLSIGTWRRIATTVGKHDLVAYVCDVKKCLTWFIHSAGFGFKMEIPFETILTTSFTNAAPGSGLASFQLSQPPIFYLENVESPDADGLSDRFWKRCSDWTEGHQATAVLHHELIGSAPQLAHVLRTLTANRGADIPLRYPSYRSEPPTSPMELPLPPMAGLTGPGYHYQPEVMNADSPPHHVRGLSSQKRSSYSGPGLTTHSPDSAYSNDSDRPPPYSAHANNSFPHHQPYAAISYHEAPTASDLGTPIYNEYAPEPQVQPACGHHGQHANDYTGAPISHGLAPRPYAAQPVPRTFYSEAPRLTQEAYDTDMRYRRSSIENHYLQPSPSPPLLTTPYHPPPHLLNNTASHTEHHHNSITPPIISGLPPVYNDHHRHHRDH